MVNAQMGNHILGVHWIPAHNRNSDLDYMRALQPSSIKIIDPDVTQIARAHAAAPNALIVLRNHPRSEQHSDVERDPEGTGKRHAQEWQRDLSGYRIAAAQRGLTLPPADKTIVLGINEQRVWQALGHVVRYEVAFLRECTALGIRAGALNLSVGWPANHGADMPADWKPYAPILPEIKRGQHYLFLHEYFDNRGARHNWRWWCGRYEQCPWDVPIIIGECGLDQYVSDPTVAKERRGWQGWYSKSEYIAQLHYYALKCAEDGRIISIQPFTTDSADTWQSFETAPAHGEILAKQWPIPKAKSTVHVPTVPASKPIGTHYVTAAAGLNVRKSPTTDGERISGLPHGARVNVTAWFGEWAELDALAQWAHGAYLSQTKPAPVPVASGPEPIEGGRDDWNRSYAFVRRWEGGYQNVENDRGNWTGGQVGVGTLKGTNFGISAASYPNLDIKNLTRAQAEEIYKRDYWRASGASELPWPSCLIVFDTAVLHGVGTAKKWLAESGPNPLVFAAKRMRVYTGMSNWHFWGVAWIKRVADLLEAAAK